MLKKIIVLSTLTLVVSNALADDISDNATTGYAQNYVTNTSQPAVSDIISKFYFGFNGGYSDINYQSVTLPPYLDSSFFTPGTNQSPIGLMGVIGYKFNPYLGLEVGYLYTFNRYEQSLIPISGVSWTQKNTDAVMLNPRFTLPLGLLSHGLSAVNIYVKGGAAYVMSAISADVAAGTPFDNGEAFSGTQSRNQIHPFYGAGLDFKMTDNFSLNLDWTHIMGSSSGPALYSEELVTNVNSSSIASYDTPVINFFSLGVKYVFDTGRDPNKPILVDKPID